MIIAAGLTGYGYYLNTPRPAVSRESSAALSEPELRSYTDDLRKEIEMLKYLSYISARRRADVAALPPDSARVLEQRLDDQAYQLDPRERERILELIEQIRRDLQQGDADADTAGLRDQTNIRQP